MHGVVPRAPGERPHRNPRDLVDWTATQDGSAMTGRSDAVRAAALFALLLELQGRDEATITRLLDRVIDDDDDLDAASAAQTRAWLDRMRHRLDMTVAAEAAS